MRLLTSFLSVVLLAAAPARPQADDLLRVAMTAPTRVSYTGEVQELRIGSDRSEASVYRVEHLAPDRSRRWYLAPQSLYGDSTISRGQMTYSIDAKHDQVLVSQESQDNDQVTRIDAFGVMMSNYIASYAADDRVEGRPVYVVLLKNKYTGQTAMRIAIDERTNLVLQRQQFAGSGALIAQMRFQRLRYTSAIDQADFTVPSTLRHIRAHHSTPSKDVAGVEKRAGFAATSPHYLPEGFEPISADVISLKGIPTLHLLFSDGLRTVSFFQNDRNAALDLSRYHPADITVGSQPAQYVEEGPTTLLAWSKGDRHYALAGEISRAELVRIASSVLP
jgi:outer membrane lipoprotein-sorting protein